MPDMTSTFLWLYLLLFGGDAFQAVGPADYAARQPQHPASIEYTPAQPQQPVPVYSTTSQPQKRAASNYKTPSNPDIAFGDDGMPPPLPPKPK